MRKHVGKSDGQAFWHNKAVFLIMTCMDVGWALDGLELCSRLCGVTFGLWQKQRWITVALYHSVEDAEMK
jgi:hypothetical protein